MGEMMHTVGKRVRAYRKKQGLSQEALAEKAGIHPTYIGKIERGETNVTVDKLADVAEALDIPFTKLFKSSEPKRETDIAEKCYEAILLKTDKQQKVIYSFITIFDDI